jgi:hypothetical protein
MNPESTHLPALLDALARTTGPVLELGMGHVSTPILAAICEQMGRPLLSIESNPEWMAKFVRMASPHHKIVQAEDLSACPEFLEWQGSVALVDHYPSINRGRDAAALKGRCEIVVMHDTEPSEESYYGWNVAYAAFANRRTFSDRLPHATQLW